MNTVAETRAKPGKYLTFALGAEDFGLEILKVREIIGYIEVTAVPQTPAYVRGVINLRGQVIPVVDLRAKFDMNAEQTTTETCIIVVETKHGADKFNTGIVVDRVRDVLDITADQIEDAPVFDASVETSFVLGMAKVADSVKILLDINRVLGSAELTGLCEMDAGSDT
jgi:purine-binding chemotaxis protein CheW